MTGSPTPRYHSARLSVILLSSGPISVLEGAIARLRGPLGSIEAHLVVVRSDEADFDRGDLDQIPGSVLLRIAIATTRDEKLGLALRHATGDIVAIRDDYDVADAQWIDAFRGSVPPRAVEELPIAHADEHGALSVPSVDRRPERRSQSQGV